MVDGERIGKLDKRHCWHPFTQAEQWCADNHEPLVIVEGKGAILRDSEGREYLDGNSSIWTNIHGHNHPTINGAIREQLARLAHSSFLGFTHPAAVELAAELVNVMPGDRLSRVFFSDDGSTAIEAALRMAFQYRQIRGEAERTTYLAFARGYHGDTLGAASVGGIDLFHGPMRGLGYPVTLVSSMDELDAGGAAQARKTNAVIIEPLVQGPAGIRPWPAGMLAELRDWCTKHGVLLIVDEVMTGFGRTGTLFACEREGVVPDFMALAKGLTGGYLPLAATLTTEAVFDKFRGTVAEGKTFYYGHSYTANPLGCAAALASLRVFREEKVMEALQPKIAFLREELRVLEALPNVKETRQCGFVAAVEVAGADDQPFPPEAQMGAKVCLAARKHGLLTRPIGDSVVLMLPLCVSEEEIARACAAIAAGIGEV